MVAMPPRRGPPAHHHARAEAVWCLTGSMARRCTWGIQMSGQKISSTHAWHLFAKPQLQLKWEKDMVCAKNGKSFNRVYQRDFLRSKTQRNPLPQCFGQCLLKHFPKCFLISPLAWSPFLSIHGVCWCFSHRGRRIREGKEEIKVLVSIFSECINFKDYPKSRTCNKIGNFSHSLWLLTEICFNGTPCPQVWPCSGSSDQTGEVSSARTLGIFPVLRRKSLSIA